MRPSERGTQWLVNKPAGRLPEGAYAAWISALATARLTLAERRPHIIRVSKRNSESSRVPAHSWWVVTGHPGGPLAAPAAVRANRWLMGKKRAAQRVWDRYGMDTLIPSGQELRPTGLLDIGANMGEFALAYAERERGQVLAFEPDPDALACLQWNTRELSIDVSPVALSDSAGVGTFFVASANGDSSLEQPRRTAGKKGQGPRIIEVATARLDSIDLRALGSNPLLKMDAEGHEPEVLRGGSQALRSFKYVAIDAGPERQGQSTAADVLAFLSALGFTTSMWGANVVHGVRTQ